MDSGMYVMKRVELSSARIDEACILASIDSPYIVKFKEAFIEKHALYLVMERCEKGDLKQFLLSQMGVSLNETKIWQLALQILAGLSLLHHHNIIHRDIKSKNILLTRDYSAKIGDFGVPSIRNCA